jgi:tricarballylate dehydrogenase
MESWNVVVVGGGLLFHNHPGGTGLMMGSVFGRRAGQAAAAVPQESTDDRR